MLTFSLQSGSNGNAIYVEANGVRLLFDAGISGKMAERRMAVHNRDVRDVQAVIISHEHRDHIGCAGVYQRKYHLPIFMTKRTHAKANKWCNLGRLNDVRYFRPGEQLAFSDLTVHTLPTAHDAVEGSAFVVECEGKRLAILTDLGHPFPGLRNVLESVDAAYLECNYDPAMLAAGPYPPRLKARISGSGGHLSNKDAAALLKACGRKRPRWIAVAHLSEQNNHPELAIEAQQEAVGRDYPIHHASRYETSNLLKV